MDSPQSAPDEDPPSRSRPPGAVVVVATAVHVLLGIVLVALALDSRAAGIFGNDVTARYQPVAELTRPWVSQPVEFPPVAVAVLEPLAWVARDDVRVLHVGLQSVVLVAIVATLWWGAGWPATRRWLLWATPLLPLALLRVDLPSVLACVAALVLARHGRELGAGVALAVGVLAKLWPGALVIAFWRDHRLSVAVGVGLSLAATLAWMLATTVDAPLQVVGFRGATGWHLESIAGTVVRLVDGGEPAIESGAWRFGDASVVPTVLLGALALVLSAVVARRVADPARVLLTTLALGLVAAPLLSTQYAVWLLAPLVLVDDLRPGEQVAAAGVVLGSVAVTFWLGDVVAGTALGWTLLVVRNAAVVALAALLTSRALRRTPLDDRDNPQVE